MSSADPDWHPRSRNSARARMLWLLSCNSFLAHPGAATAAARDIAFISLAASQTAPTAPSNAAPQARRTATISLPLIVDDRQLADVAAELTSDAVLAVSPTGLADALGGIINKDTQAALRGMGEGLTAVDRVRELGIDLRLNPQTLSLVATLDIKIRAPRVYGEQIDPIDQGLTTARPSRFAAGLTGGLLVSSDLSALRINNVSLGVASFVNIGGERGLNVVGGGTIGLSGFAPAFQRDRIVAFVDRPDSALRYSLGDLALAQTRLSGNVDLLGLSIERSYSLLQPIRNIRPVGNRSFILERRSTIEIYNNGALVQSFVAEAGPIDLRNISSANLSNNVSIVVQDSLGRREVSSFAIANDINLLQRGFSEFQFAAGVLRNPFSSSSFSYSHDPIVTGIYSRGVSDTVTLVGNFAATQRAQQAGASINVAILRGVALVEISGSNTRSLGSGVAIGVSYRGDPFGLPADANANLNLRATWQSVNYRTINTFDLRNTIKVDAIADYRFNLSRRLSISFGGSYYQTYGTARGDWAIFAGAQQSIGRFSLSLNGRFFSRSDGRQDVGAFITITRLFGRSLTATANVDTTAGRGRFEIRKTRSLNLPEVEYAINAQYGPQNTQIGGNIAYATSRFESELTIINQLSGGNGLNNSLGQLRLQSGIGFVDGQLGIGRNTANGFVMVSRHRRLREADIEVSEGAGGRRRGFVNDFGPAVIPVDNSFRPLQLRLSAEKLPEGLDIGAGDYVVRPGARSGIHITVGSDAFHTIIAILTQSEGKPLSLRAGSIKTSDGKVVGPVFTNREGRAVATMLAPGRYVFEFDGVDQQFSFDIPNNDEAITNLGVVKMEDKP